MNSCSHTAQALASLNVGCLQALRALLNAVLYGLAFFQRTESEALDCAVVSEDVGGASAGAMKPKPFSALNHFTVPVAMLFPYVFWPPTWPMKPCRDRDTKLGDYPWTRPRQIVHRHQHR